MTNRANQEWPADEVTEITEEQYGGNRINSLVETVDEVLAANEEPASFASFAREMFGKPFIVPPTVVAELEEEL
jgi:hypothetical protein